MDKKNIAVVFLIALVVAAVISIVSATSKPTIPTDGTSLVIQNVSPLALTFSIEGGGQSISLGVTKPGESLTTKDALMNNGLLSTLDSNEFTIHAKQANGSEFYTLMIDRDELFQRKGGVSIPGPGGRRQVAALLGKPTSAPAPTAVP